MQPYDDQEDPLLQDDSDKVNQAEWSVDGTTIPSDVLFKPSRKASKLPQFIAAIVCCLAAVSFGTVLGYSSPTIEQLKLLGLLDDEKASWHAAIVPLGAVGGGLVGGICMDKLGRKGTLIACGVPFTVGWLMIMAVGMANSFILLLAGRYLTGVTVGIVCMAAPTYIAEISTPELRGTLGNLFQLAATIGLLLAFSLGISLTWQWLAMVSAIMAATMSIAVFFIPETPIYLASKGYEGQTLASLRWLRGDNYDYEGEYHNILEAHLGQADASRVTLLEVLTQKCLYKPILITFGLMLFQQCSGINNVMFYTEPIFESAGSDNPALAGVIIGAVQVVATLFSVFIIGICGRRFLLLLSGSFMIISCVTLGLFYYLNDVKGFTNIGWLPLASLILYVIAFSIGWGPIPWTMMPEIVPARLREVISGLAIFVNWMSAFLITKEFPAMQAAMTKQGTFWFFAGVNLLGLFFSALCVPETKGKSLVEIEQQFKR